LLTLILTGCGTRNPADAAVSESVPAPSTNAAAELPSISNYFPIKTNTFYEFESPTLADLNQQVYVTYAEGNRVQRRVSTEKATATEVLEYANGQLRLVFGEPQFYYYENILTAEPSMDTLLLQEPLQVGQKWSMNADMSAEITDMEAIIATPFGELKTMEVTASFASGQTQKEYYAPDIGLVKTVYDTREYGLVEYSLVRVTEQAALNPTLNVYFVNGGQLTPEEKTIEISTNSDLAAVFSQALRDSAQGYADLLPADAKINSIRIDRAVGGLYLDLSQEFMNAANAAGDSEQIILQGMADTLGGFFDISKIHITIDGVDYKMGAEEWLTARQDGGDSES
jgi:hypothetical protein